MPLIYLFVGWAVLMPVFLLINRAIFGIFEISDTKALDGSPIIFFSIIAGQAFTTLAATPLLTSLVFVAIIAGNLLRRARLAYYRMDSPCPEMAAEEQIDRLAQQFPWKVKERKPGRLVAAPERSRLVRIHVECDGQGFHVAAFHLLNPLAPARCGCLWKYRMPSRS